MVPNGARSPRVWTYGTQTEARDFARLIRACRQIHQDAAALFYASYTFTFNTVTAFTKWLRRIGSMRQHLQAIVLDTPWRASLKPALNSLKEAKTLKTFCTYAVLNEAYTAKQVANDCKPLFVTLAEAKASKQDGMEVVNIFQQIPHSMESRRAQNRGEKIPTTSSFAIEVRTELKKLLKT
jgi:hypothetical protein